MRETVNAVRGPLSARLEGYSPILGHRGDVERSWLKEFEEFLGETRAKKTVGAYLQDVRHFCGWFERANGESFGPGLLNTRDLKDYRTWCVEVDGSAPATWNRRRATLRVLCGWIQETQGVAALPRKAIDGALKAEREQEQAPRWLEPQEERRLMRQVEINVNAARTVAQRERAIRDQAMIALMRYAGLRVEETAEVQLADVEISERRGEVTVRGKREKTRHVPLSSSARDALRMWLAIRATTRVAPTDARLFGSVSPRAIQKRVEDLAADLRIEGLSCHALRHTCAKQMVDAGRPLTEVQKILGHEKLETTSRYVQPGREDLASAVEAGELGRLRRKS
jgi:site-specific recombinase XerD